MLPPMITAFCGLRQGPSGLRPCRRRSGRCRHAHIVGLDSAKFAHVSSADKCEENKESCRSEGSAILGRLVTPAAEELRRQLPRSEVLDVLGLFVGCEVVACPHDECDRRARPHRCVVSNASRTGTPEPHVLTPILYDFAGDPLGSLVLPGSAVCATAREACEKNRNVPSRGLCFVSDSSS